MNDTTFGKMLVLTEVIAEQTLVNSNSFKKMMVVLKDHSVRVGNCTGNSTDNGTRLRGKHYYWTHEPSYNKDHNSAKCKNRADGHVATATWNNKLGGTDRDTTTCTQLLNASKIKTLNKLNELTLYSTALDTTTTRISPSVADTGATCAFLEMNVPYITNIM